MHGSGWWTFLSYDETKGKPQVDRALLRRVGVWARPYTRHIVGMLALLLIISLVELVPPLLYGQLIDGLMPDPRTGTPGLTPQRLNLLAAGLLSVPILSSLLGVAQRHISATIGEGLIYDLRVAAYEHVQRMGLRFFTQTKTGDIISRLHNDVIGAQTAVSNTIPNLASNALTLATTLVIMIGLDWRLTLLAVAVLPLFLLPTRRVGRLLREIRREAAGHDAALSSQLQETTNVSGALLLRAFGRQSDSVAELAAVARRVRDIGIRRAIVGRWFFLGLGIAGAIGTALMYWVGGHLALMGPEQGGISPGLIVTFAAYLARLYGPISALSNVQVEFVTSLVSFERVFEYLDLPVEIDEPEHPVPVGEPAGAVRFEGVWFAYDELPPALAGLHGPRAGGLGPVGPAVGAEDAGSTRDAPSVASDGGAAHRRDDEPGDTAWTLRGIDFVMRPGTLTALVGPSGAGKTTISYLLARLYDPSRGRITLDGIDLREIGLSDLAGCIGMVTQETFLFNDSVRANLAFARPAATESQIEDACRAANILEVVRALPKGLDTVVGERGYRLSGGEKQRLAIARVILKDPAVLILDEATSHLDSHSEALVQEALSRVLQGRTSLVIAHRLSTVLKADQILVLDAGRIAQRGRHAELLDSGGLYAELYKTQLASDEDAVLLEPAVPPSP